MNCSYVSIGWNCNPRVFIKNNLKMTKSSGYKTGPFDLCVTQFPALVKCINSNFANFFDNLRLIPGENAPGDRTGCGPGGNNITNAYGMIFNHEGSTHSHMFSEGKNDDDYYIRNNFQKFKERYIKRINNFRNYIKFSREIVLIFNKHPDENYDDHEILKLFNTAYPGKKFILYRES
jgi:hypothetical protein